MPYQGSVGYRLPRVWQFAYVVFPHARQSAGGRQIQRPGSGGTGAVCVGVPGLDLRPRGRSTDRELATPSLVCDGDAVVGDRLVCFAQHPIRTVQRVVCLIFSLARKSRRPVGLRCVDQSERRGLTLGVMANKSRTISALLAVVALIVFLTGCFHRSSQQAASNLAAAEFATALRNRVSTEAMMAHLSKLQDIANANNGTRAVGTPGYDASVDYVANTLRAKGFDVQTPEFSARVFHADKPSVTVNGKTVDAHALDYSLATPSAGLTGPLVAAPARDNPGCAASDYDGLPVQGAVVLVDRGSCPFARKEDAAAQRGAVAMVVADNVDEQQLGGTLGADT